MPAPTPTPPPGRNSSSSLDRFLTEFHRWGFRARFLTISLMVHMIIVLLGGSAVLFTMDDAPDDFAGSVQIAGDGADAPPPMDDMTAPSVMDPIPPTSALVTSPAIEAITAASAKSNFQLSTATVSPARIGHGEVGSLGKGLGDGMGSTVGGKIGGKGRFFGTKEKFTNALVGTFYDLKQDRKRKPTGMTPDGFNEVYREFVREGWRESILSKYFKAPNRLYATQLLIPNMSADEGPKAFEMEKEVQPSRWLVHYQGRVSPPEDGRYRFVGAGDDVMIVRFNGKVVLDRCWYSKREEWKSDRDYDYGYTNIPRGFARGDVIDVRAGQFYDIEVLIGEEPGGLVFFSLLMEQEGVEYQKDARGNPIFPVFRLADLPAPEALPGQSFPPFQPGGPVWKAASIERNSGMGFDDFFGRK